MDYPILYAVGSISWSGNGLGALVDVVKDSCKVVEQLNTSFEMSMQYPITGRHFTEIKLHSIIKCKPNPYDDAQPFLVYKISKPLNGIVTIYAEHITYVVDNYIVPPQELYADLASDAAVVMTFLNEAVTLNEAGSGLVYQFSFSTDGLSTSKKWSFSKLQTIREVRSFITNTFGGEWKFDDKYITLVSQRGTNRGVSIVYGKNMTDFNCDNSSDSAYTHVCPYWYGLVTDATTSAQTMALVYADPTFIPISSGDNEHFLPYILDCSSYFSEEPESAELTIKAMSFLEDNPTMGNSEKNYRVRFIEREKTIECPHLTNVDHVEIGDSIVIKDSRYNIVDTRRCIKTTYNVCAGCYTDIELGSNKKSITTFVASSSTSKTNTANYGGGYNEYKSNIGSTEKIKTVRSIETTESSGVVQKLVINFDDGSSTSLQCTYNSESQLTSFGSVKITHTEQEETT